MASTDVDFDDGAPPRGRWWKRIAYGLAVSVAGSAIFIGMGQAWVLAGGTCSTLCKPEIAGVYGALSGVVFAFIYKPAS